MVPGGEVGLSIRDRCFDDDDDVVVVVVVLANLVRAEWFRT